MPSGPQATVAVEYRFIDGYHVFTSRDVYGLYVASKDPRKAFDGVAPAIQQLLTKEWPAASRRRYLCSSFWRH